MHIHTHTHDNHTHTQTHTPTHTHTHTRTRLHTYYVGQSLSRSLLFLDSLPPARAHFPYDAHTFSHTYHEYVMWHCRNSIASSLPLFLPSSLPPFLPSSLLLGITHIFDISPRVRVWRSFEKSAEKVVNSVLNIEFRVLSLGITHIWDISPCVRAWLVLAISSGFQSSRSFLKCLV